MLERGIARILLIDDDKDLLRSQEIGLTRAGFSVAKAYDGRDALFKIRNERFRLVITDIKMPKLSGIELIECLREQESEWQSICPIIISSGYIDDFVYGKYSNIGRIHFMPKPVFLGDLLNKVSEVLDVPLKKPQLDVKFVNPILGAISSTISEMAGHALQAGRPHLKKENEASGDISGIVGVVSAGFRGNISVSFSEAGFLRLVSRFTRIQFTQISNEIKDAISQLMTTIFVEARRQLQRNGLDIQTSVPSIVTGRGHCVDHKLNSPTVTVTYSSPEFGECRVEICAIS